MPIAITNHQNNPRAVERRERQAQPRRLNVRNIRVLAPIPEDRELPNVARQGAYPSEQLRRFLELDSRLKSTLSLCCFKVVQRLYCPETVPAEEREVFDCSVDELTKPLTTALKNLMQLHPIRDEEVDKADFERLFINFRNLVGENPQAIDAAEGALNMIQTATAILMHIDSDHFSAVR